MKQYLFILFLGFHAAFLQAQNDSLVLNYDFYIQNITNHHPLARKAEIQSRRADAEMLSAKGNFDPKVKAGWDEKLFDEKNYYRIFQAGLEVPTWYGITATAKYENTSGEFLNPENNTDKFGLWSVGIEANILQGLLIDKRRADLLKAKVTRRITENEKDLILNQLFYSASIAYLDWQSSQEILNIIEGNISLANEYFSATKEAFIQGDKPAIDTLEAFLIIQDQELLYQEAELKYIKSKQQLENFIWQDGKRLDLLNTTIPIPFENNPINLPESQAVAQLVNNHPEIIEKQNKLSVLGIEGRLKRDKLKPKLKLKYNPLLTTSDNSLLPNYSINNFKWGFDFSIPILLRSERAAIQLNNFKINEVELELENKINELQNKIEASQQQQIILQQQIKLQEENLNNYRLLLEAEREKFSYGESSVFLLNKRQEKFISTQIKRIKTIMKYRVELLNYLFLTNQF